jgi:hypothetical protein
MPSLAPSLNLLLGGSLSIHQNNDVGAPQLPTKVEAEALFQRYAEAVSPLAHVLHTPSFKRLFDRFWLNIEMGSPNQNSCTALILAVCMAAAASVSPLQAKSQFGITKEDLFLRLQKATERALLRANWAKTSNIRTLQALTIYLVNITARYRHKQIKMLIIIDPSLSRPNFARHFCCRGCPCAPCPMHRNPSPPPRCRQQPDPTSTARPLSPVVSNLLPGLQDRRSSRAASIYTLRRL